MKGNSTVRKEKGLYMDLKPNSDPFYVVKKNYNDEGKKLSEGKTQTKLILSLPSLRLLIFVAFFTLLYQFQSNSAV